jgi:hypothetical protein
MTIRGTFPARDQQWIPNTGMIAQNLLPRPLLKRMEGDATIQIVACSDNSRGGVSLFLCLFFTGLLTSREHQYMSLTKRLSGRRLAHATILNIFASCFGEILGADLR